ncbi:hypothetical protein BJV77DRAFT_726893 [Russula vinacea]|nr:hypothetical protein BJV77DRAFT_726893 [Russula vinacea]
MLPDEGIILNHSKYSKTMGGITRSFTEGIELLFKQMVVTTGPRRTERVDIRGRCCSPPSATGHTPKHLGKTGVKVDSRGRTSVVIDDYLPAAEYIRSKHGHMNYEVTPSVVYTHPEVEWVDKTEQDLKKDGARYKSGRFPFVANLLAEMNLDSEGQVKFLIEETDRILGVQMFVRCDIRYCTHNTCTCKNKVITSHLD